MERELSATIADFIEECRRESREKFVDQMQYVHRTLLQCFAGLVFAWLNDYADSRTDERNQSSVDFVAELKNLYREATGEEGFKERFPFI